MVKLRCNCRLQLDTTKNIVEENEKHKITSTKKSDNWNEEKRQPRAIAAYKLYGQMSISMYLWLWLLTVPIRRQSDQHAYVPFAFSRSFLRMLAFSSRNWPYFPHQVLQSLFVLVNECSSFSFFLLLHGHCHI